MNSNLRLLNAVKGSTSCSLIRMRGLPQGNTLPHPVFSSIYSNHSSSPLANQIRLFSGGNNPQIGDNDVQIPPVAPIKRHNETLQVKKARILYQTRKRGILENDLIISTFFDKYGDGMSEGDVDDLDKLLDQNDWDVYYWCTEKKPVPEPFRGMRIMPMLIEHTKNRDKKILRQPDL
eukprot:Nk52_evm1s132 gene=Nk52_evmTU1s132